MQSSPKENQTDKEADYYLPQSAKSYHFPNVGGQAIAKILCSFNGKLGWQVINRTHENAISFHTIKKKSRDNDAFRDVFTAPQFVCFFYSIKSHLYLSWSMCWLASYMQKGFSMVVHSVMNSMEPPVSAEMSQIAKNLRRIDKEEKNKFSEYLILKAHFSMKHSYTRCTILCLKLKNLAQNQNP